MTPTQEQLALFRSFFEPIDDQGLRWQNKLTGEIIIVKETKEVEAKNAPK